MSPAAGPARAPATARGLRACRRITRRHARTFYLASHGLPRAVRAHAYAVYGFCRWADDSVDCAAHPDDARARLGRARDALGLAYGDDPAAPPGLLAFRRAVRERGIPRHLFESLLDGMAMDLHVARYPDFAALDLYCYRVAGVVGLMMTHLFGYRDPRCFPRAVALGRAMQLTNILRDVAEDLARGRIYLPRDELDRFGVSESQLAEGRVDANFRALMRFQIERARRAYAEAELGIPDLIGASSRLTVRVMSALYGGILAAIEALDYDVFRARAFVPTPARLRTLAACHLATWRESLARFLQ
jgi:phytoene synthase